MDMLRSNAISISNPTPWPTIFFEPIYICLHTENHAFPIIHGPILIPLSKLQACENMFMTQKWFPLLHLCTQSNLSQTRLTMISNNNLHVSNWSCFVVAIPSRPSVQEWYIASSLGLQETVDALLFASQYRSLRPSSYVLKKIGSCPLKRQFCK